ncbi:MAG: CDP-alcohol phosphatidyltransferase family protein [Desulfurobacteriaceae bacterium]
MISSTQLKNKTQEIFRPLAEVLGSFGVSPSLVTVLGFFFSVISAFFLVKGDFLNGTLFFVLSGLCDTFDGILARVTGRSSSLGAFLDSFLDRYSDFLPLAGIIFFAHYTGDDLLMLLVLLSILGSFATSYARARAESLGIECKVGLLERPERFFLVLFGLVTGFLTFAFLLMAILSNFTALQRLYCAFEKLREKE